MSSSFVLESRKGKNSEVSQLILSPIVRVEKHVSGNILSIFTLYINFEQTNNICVSDLNFFIDKRDIHSQTQYNVRELKGTGSR